MHLLPGHLEVGAAGRDHPHPRIAVALALVDVQVGILDGGARQALGAAEARLDRPLVGAHGEEAADADAEKGVDHETQDEGDEAHKVLLSIAPPPPACGPQRTT